MPDTPDLSALDQVPEHYKQPTSEELAQRVTNAPAPANSGVGREHRFHIRWTDPSGKAWDGDFLSRVPSVAEEISIGRMKAQLIGGTSLANIDDEAMMIAHMVAYLQFALKERPDWLKDVLAIQHITLLQLVYQEVANHVHAFRVGKSNPGAGKAGA